MLRPGNPTQTIEQACERYFAIKLTIAEVIAANIPTGVASQAALFRVGQHNAHYLFVASPSLLTLGDVVQIVRRMGLEAEAFLPPHGDTDYFKRIGVERFKQMFPGKPMTGPEDIRYYQTLARYNPALVKLSQVKGTINAYMPANKQWRKLKDYSYSKMKLS
jgi:hypothetical protein